jgi:diguanylate cyclase (GGDEF)-like protein
MAGLTVFALTDAISRSRIPAGIHALGHPLDLAWLLASVLLGAASLQAPPRARMTTALEGWIAVIAPTGLAFAAAVLLVIGRFDHLSVPSLTLARVAIGIAFVRLFVSFAANQRLLAKSRRDAVSDELTGLGNRRALIADLDALFDSPELNPHVLAIYDLDGFKNYNDTFGHPAGDALLARLGASLEAAVGRRGKVYRLGGDEFCLLAEVDGPATDSLVAEAAEGLVEESARFAIRPSFGAAILPREASDQAEALRLADERMYAQKTTRPSPRAGARSAFAAANDPVDHEAAPAGAPAERLFGEQRLGGLDSPRA